jgi:plasmid stability protein
VRQLLLRVPDEMHQRLAARARREGRSINAIANEILESSADVDLGSTRDRVRARAVAAGILARPHVRPTGAGMSREEVLDALSGVHVTADELLDVERGRMDGIG